MKKILSAVLAGVCAITCATAAAGCSGGFDGNEKINIVTTMFAPYDWVKNIAGDTDAEITRLNETGVDLHSYQPSVQDIAKISTCDLFIYVGGESESWVDGALANALNKDMQTINLMECLGDAVKEEEEIEGAEDDHDHDHGEEETEYDEHVWLSLSNAKVICEEIAEVLTRLSPDNGATYSANLAKYLGEIDALDAQYRTAVNAGVKDTLIFADRFPFLYLVKDYELKYYAAFSGCSTESSASAATIVFLANKVDELDIKVLLTTESPVEGVAETVKTSTQSKDQQILTLNSLQSVKKSDAEGGITYLSVMESNLDIIKEALK